jgi:N-acetyl sugar amidotransferase
MTAPYRICTKCVMDTSDPDITFNEAGVCNHCGRYDVLVQKHILTGEAAQKHLAYLVQKIRRGNERKRYDCVIGVSGGVDSSYVAYKVKQLGLRPLAVHLDNGWDSELAVKNIENLLRILEIDLYTEVLDWEEFKDLQLAFLRASTPDSEIPTDHAIFAVLKKMARRIGVKHIIAGMNIRTETHLPAAWSQGHFDWKYIKSVHNRFGTVPLRTFPHVNLIETRLLFRNVVSLLDSLDYVKSDAMQVLERELGWRYYGGKHYESIYTRFYQGYILPHKFGYDKRRTHLSSLICSGEKTRDEAVADLQEASYPLAMQESDQEYVIKKLGITETAFWEIMNAPPKSYWDYPSYGRIYRSRPYVLLRSVYRRLRARPRPEEEPEALDQRSEAQTGG